MKPFFIPLKKKYFLQFKSGEKTSEFRRPGRAYVKKNFPVNRPVILSCGYSGERINAVVKFVRHSQYKKGSRLAFEECYPDAKEILEIGFKIMARR